MSFSKPTLSRDCLWQLFDIIVNTFQCKEIQTTLFSCLLVNRQWCELSILFLWKNPFFNPNLHNQKKKLLCKTILSCSSLTNFTMIKDMNKNLMKSLPKLQVPLFNYVNYIRHFNSAEIDIMAHLLFTSEEWNHHTNEHLHDVHSLINELWKIFVYHCSPISLNNIPYQMDITLLTRSGLFFSKITELECDNSSRYDQKLITSTYKAIAKVCRNIQNINVNRFEVDNEGLTYLIKVQNGLKEINIMMDDNTAHTNVFKEIRSQSKSLNHLTFSGNVRLPNEIFTSMSNLKSLHLKLIHECGIRHKKGAYEVLPLTLMRALENASLPNLESFCLKYNNDISVPWFQPLHTFQKLISTTRNGSMRKIDIESKLSVYPDSHIHAYMKTITTFCPLLEFLGICYKDIAYEDFEQLLLNCDKLKILKLEFIKEPLIQIEYDDGEGNRRRYTKILELLADKAPDSLRKLYLKNPLYITKYNLWDFLDMWKNNERNLLHLELIGMIEVKEEYEEVFEQFIRKNILLKDSAIKGKSFCNL
ncbi:4913_t:CDS:1 [Funneliformis mosseae]|uniref:4913_t:CDS:1 n=1 Tax=Funneliformis mosseae TaxID=27381 RepID=A0A9N8VDN0_FUNMO|nr:4913_t:CDS:1 [Funneliformis mosseae]